MARITDKEITARPKGKDSWLYDGSPNKGHGELCVRITPGGSRRFYFRYIGPEGKRDRLPIGSYDPSGQKGLKLKDARVKAGELSLLHQSGISDIRGHLETLRRQEEARIAAEEARLEAERKAAEIEAARLSVNELFEKWESAYLRQHRKDEGKEVRRQFELDVLPKIGDVPAHLVRKGNVMEIVDAILERGSNRTAKMVFGLIRQMFLFAFDREIIDADPTASIKKRSIGGRDVERERVLSEDEVRALAQAIPGAGLIPSTEAAIWIALATGCRIGELLKARWEHVDLKKRIWKIPAENAKNGLAIEVYLSDFALKQFELLKQCKRSDWLYPARNKSKGDTHVCTKTVTKQVTDRQKQAAMTNRSSKTSTLILSGEHWTLHDLRRTCSTLMISLGVQPEIADRCTNHKESNKVRRIYQRYSYKPEMRKAWEVLGAHLELLVDDRDAAKVIPLAMVRPGA